MNLLTSNYATKKLWYFAGVWVSKSPKDLVLELTWKHWGWSEHISWEAISIWPMMHLSEQILMHFLASTIIFPKILRLKGQFENLAKNIYNPYFHQSI